MKNELLDCLDMALDWIDAVPKDLVLPVMPGFDRDYVEDIRARARLGHVKYFGIEHRTNIVREYSLPQAVSTTTLFLMLSTLNKHAHTYGITYYIEEEPNVV